MRTYRIATRDGKELATVAASNVTEVIATPAASGAPLDAEIVAADSGRVLARRELWTGGAAGWSLVPADAPRAR